MRDGYAKPVSILYNALAFIGDVEQADYRAYSPAVIRDNSIKQVSNPYESQHDAFLGDTLEACCTGNSPVEPSNRQARKVIYDNQDKQHFQ